MAEVAQPAQKTVQLFLSTVSAEFRSYRDQLRHDLARTNVTVAVQEDFIVTGTETLAMLDDYIRQCDAVVHLVGDMSGAMAKVPSVQALRQRYPDLADRLPPLRPFLHDDKGGPALSYTQWEAWLALLHGKRLIIAVPDDAAPRNGLYQCLPVQQASQQAHLRRLAEVERYPGIHFANADRLAVEVLRSGVFDLLVNAGAARRIAHLPYRSLGELFKGRDGTLQQLHASLEGAAPGGASAIVDSTVVGSKAVGSAATLHGLGGVGKTRLAVEYAWQHADAYTAMLFVGADGPQALQRNLAALCAPAVLDLPEHGMTDEAAQSTAALQWLQSHPGWLLILDNVDSEDAAAAVEQCLPLLTRGQVLITSRVTHWGADVQALPLGVLNEAAAAGFLLARTQGRRRQQADDADQAASIARELGGLALALEQTGAYICQRRLTLAAYLSQWRDQRSAVLAWYDARLMKYPKSVAITWQTSFDQLSESAQRLLQRLAWLAPEPIPESLLQVQVPEVVAEGNALEALVELEGYSLVARAVDAPSFTLHRLVQAVTRQRAEAASLAEALRWINRAFVGGSMDVRNWPVLEPLLPHAREVVGFADQRSIAEPTSRLMNRSALLLRAKALNAEAEPLMRRALAIGEQSFGTEHPKVVTRVNNLAQLLKATNRLGEAELLMRRALTIDEQSFGATHPRVATQLNNLAALLHATNRLSDAEPLMRRALAIDEQSFGAEHPKVAIRLNNLALLLKATNRLGEAEPLIRRALTIDEKSLGVEHPNVAIRLGNQAVLLHASNRLSEAEPLMHRALAIDEQSFGAEHPRVAAQLNNLAQLLQATNRLSEAEPLMRRALTIDEKSFGAEHPNVARDLNNLARLLQDTNRLNEAEPLMRRAVTICVNGLVEGHPWTHGAANNYSHLLRALGEDEATISARIAALTSRPDQPPTA